VKLLVECRVDPRRREVPVRFGSPGRMQAVDEVLDCWHGDRTRDFRVRADDGSVYILRHDLDADVWAIHFFHRSPGSA
jgi:hypothetical protein